MAVDELAPFLQLGPFLGLDNSTAEAFVAEGMAVYARNCNTYRHKKGLTAERGRVEIGNFSGQFSAINVLFYFQGLSPFSPNGSTPMLLMQGPDPGNSFLVTYIYDILSAELIQIYFAEGVETPVPKFTQAIQFGQVVYTNGGHRIFVYNLAANPYAYFWQYTGFATLFEAPFGTYTITGAPATGQHNDYVINGVSFAAPQFTGNTDSQQATADVEYLNIQPSFNATAVASTNATPGVVVITALDPGVGGGDNTITTTGSSTGGDTLTANQAVLNGSGSYSSTTGGNIPQETRFYVTTQTATMPDGTISETSPENYPTPFQITSGAGTTNSNTLILQDPTHSPFAGSWPDGTTFVTNVYAQSSLQAGYFLAGVAATNANFVDTLSDAQLATGAPLFVADGSAFQRDPPPVGIATIPSGGTPFDGVLNQNYAFMCVFSSCIFILTHIDPNIIEGSPYSTQLWYSQAGIGWEFSSDTRALLLQDTTENTLPPVTAPLVASSPQYNQLFGDFAKGLAVCGTTLVAWKHKEMWILYGTGASTSPFTQISAFNVGAQSIRAITPCVGGAYVKTENGVYFFDGQTPAYSENNFVTVNSNPPYAHNISDDVATVGAFSHFSYVLSFPTLRKTYVLNTLLNQWMSELPYAAASQDAVCYAPADPTIMSQSDPGPTSMSNFMCAVRAGAPTIVDFWFADDAGDLGVPTVFYWEGPESDSPGTEFKKVYQKITVFAPIQPGTCTVKLSIDGRMPPYVVSFDLSGPRPLIANIPGSPQGFSAKLSVECSGLPGQPAPQLWKIACWGISPPQRRLEVPQ